MAKASLLILAAGLGSRYVGGIKQLEGIGPNGEIIMDYSIHDAIKAGFDKVIFVIRKDIEQDFKDVIGNRIEEVCKANNVEVCYAFQSINALPEGYTLPEGRTKPWGTGHAVLAAKEHIKEPFIVINADDYYGKDCYKSIFDFLTNNKDNEICLAGFVLKNTLSDHGSVNRGVCQVNGDVLTNVKETLGITKNGEAAISAAGEIIDVNSYVSMNMWGLTKEYVNELENDFTTFLDNLKNPLKDEFFIPTHVDSLIKSNKIVCKVIETHDRWLGVTYKEDKEHVVKAMNELYDSGVYNSMLYSDL